METSAVTGIRYEDSDCVRIFNMVQAARYIEKGNAKVIDVCVINGALCIKFYRSDVHKLFVKWIEHTL